MLGVQGGSDVGDHPPITPVVMATEHDLDTDSWRIYDYVTRHFLGSVSGDCVYCRTKASFSCAGESFTATGTAPVRPGFTAVMPWRVSLEHILLLISFLSLLPGQQMFLFLFFFFSFSFLFILCPVPHLLAEALMLPA